MIHKLYKQLMSQNSKSHTNVTVWTKNGNVVISKKEERNIQATAHQSRLSKNYTYHPEDNDRKDESEGSGT